VFPDKLLTTEQVADLLQVHPFTVLKYIKDKKLKAFKLGRVWRIRESDVEKFLEDRSMASKEPIQNPEIKEIPKKEKIKTDENMLPNDKSDHYILE
jgi:excisionase family DNA binding protein